MKKRIYVFWTIFFRELFPARDATGWPHLIYQVFVFYLPILGIGLLLMVISYSGICLISAEQSLNQRIEAFKTSPFTALFAKGYFFAPKKGQEGAPWVPKNLRYWEAMPIKEVLPYTNLPGSLSEAKLFSGVKPFSWIYLHVTCANGEHLAFQQGMGIPIRGEAADQMLITEIQRRLSAVYHTEQQINGIIVSAEGMQRFGWSGKDDYPELLWVRLSSRHYERAPYIPVPLLVVDRLPYQFLYVMPMDLLNRLEKGYYYQTSNILEIQSSHHLPPVEDQQFVQLFPPGTRFTQLMRSGTPTLRLIFPSPMTRIDILTRLADNRLLTSHTRVFMGTADTVYYESNYQGAIFHLNFQLPDHFMWQKEHIYAIQNFMERKAIKVEGEVVELLSEILANQKNLRKIQDFFSKGLFLILGVLLFFFAVVLHSRMHRIGIQRMLGYPDWLIVCAYMLVSLVLVCVTFSVSVLIMQVGYNPFQTELAMDMSLVKLFFIILGITETGFLIPIVFYLYALQPAEMLTFQS